MKVITAGIIGALSMGCIMLGVGAIAEPPAQAAAEQKPVSLGNFSVSLSVKDLAASQAFYTKLGLKKIGGDGKGYVIMQSDTATIGLFQGMFEKNTLTFNPGWDRNAKDVEGFTDVRDIQKLLVERGLTITVKADESTTGPGFCMLLDPDGNPVLLDQHTSKPVKKE